jgi:hypothetical protein
MRRDRGREKKGGRPGAPQQPPQGPEERAGSLLRRLETGGPNPVNAAEEIDRLQGRLERDGRLPWLREQVRELCDAWAAAPLRGDRAHAWLVLAGGFGFGDLAPRAASVAEDSGLPAPLRVRACRVLASLGGEEAVAALQAVLLSATDAQVRAAAADALAELGDRSVRPVLEALLEEDLPPAVWNSVTAALERLR